MRKTTRNGFLARVRCACIVILLLTVPAAHIAALGPGGDPKDVPPELATDGEGHWLAAWPIGYEDCLVTAYSGDNGATWGESTTVKCPRSVSWVQLFDRNGGGGWWVNASALASLSPEGKTMSDIRSWGPEGSDHRYATDGMGRWVVAYVESHYGCGVELLWVASSSDRGATWNAKTCLSDLLPMSKDGKSRLGALEHREVHVAWDNGAWMVVWVGKDEMEEHLWSSRSFDDGNTWSAPKAITGKNRLDWMELRDPVLCPSSNGTSLLAWWTTHDVGDGPPPEREILLCRTGDKGKTWGEPVQLNSAAMGNGNEAQAPRLASNGHGHWVAVWESRLKVGEDFATDTDIVSSYSDDDGKTWSVPAPVSPYAGRNLGDDHKPCVKFAGGNRWLTAWSSKDSLGKTKGRDPEPVLAVSTDDGKTWGAPALLKTQGPQNQHEKRYLWNNVQPSIASDGNGHWIAAWSSEDDLDETIGNDPDILYARSDDHGSTWSLPKPVDSQAVSDVFRDYDPAVCYDGAGAWIVTWKTYSPFKASIHWTKSTDSGNTWSPTQRVPEPEDGHLDSYEGFSLAGGTNGRWLLLCEDGKRIGGSGRILISQLEKDAEQWSAPKDFSPPISKDQWPREHHASPSLATDGKGVWVATWNGSYREKAKQDLRSGTFIRRSTNDGASWTSAAPLCEFLFSSDNNGARGYVAASTDKQGHWMTTGWADLEEVRTYQPVPICMHSLDAGATWSPAVRIQTQGQQRSEYTTQPSLATDGKGHWVAVWLQGTCKYVVARSMDGGQTWTVQNFATSSIAPVSNSFSPPNLATDSKGHWVMVGATGSDKWFQGPQEIFSISSHDNGETWTEPLRFPMAPPR